MPSYLIPRQVMGKETVARQWRHFRTRVAGHRRAKATQATETDMLSTMAASKEWVILPFATCSRNPMATFRVSVVFLTTWILLHFANSQKCKFVHVFSFIFMATNGGVVVKCGRSMMMTVAAALFSGCALLAVRGVTWPRSVKTKRIIHGKSDLNEFMAGALQPMLDSYAPTWWTNSHIQCFLTFLVPQYPVKYKRDVLTLKDGGQASLDWALESSVELKSPLKDDAPIAIIMHGLVGCSESMRSLCAEALAHGYRPVVFNKRGHGGMKLATPKLQEFGCVRDLEEAIAHVEKMFPNSELYGIGCSAGAGLLCSYLCELGDTSHLQAGVLISPGYNAFDLFCGGKINPVYNFLMTFTLKSFLLRHKNELDHVVNVSEALKATSIREFDQHVYMKMHGYDDLESYWKVNNPMRDVDNLKMPLLCINALDDPVCTKETIPYDVFLRKPKAMLMTTSEGSHCAFFEGNFQLKSWCHNAAMTYLDRLREFNTNSGNENIQVDGPTAAATA